MTTVDKILNLGNTIDTKKLDNYNQSKFLHILFSLINKTKKRIEDIKENENKPKTITVNTNFLEKPIKIQVEYNHTVNNILESIANRYKITRDNLLLGYKGNIVDSLTTVKDLQIKLHDSIDIHKTKIIGKIIQIFIVTLTGKRITISIGQDNTIIDLKWLISGREYISYHKQRMIFAGKQLFDDNTLSIQNICNYSTLHLVLRLRGGMFHETSSKKDYTDLIGYLNNNNILAILEADIDSLKCNKLEEILKKTQNIASTFY